ncbi:MAG: class I SAM-dependent methyltransferase [Deltaproteobacteria bacterium]|nr:class I SAM-dependent methyltransferase [Deltaproteobacteria bacterium]
MVDERTQAFYAANAKSVAEQHHSIESPSEAFFAEAFPPFARVFDLGTGSGRDLALLLEGGWDAFGLEPSEELRRCALERHPRLEGRLFAGSLPEDLPDELLEEPFEGLLCSAVLQHLPLEDLPAAAKTLARLLAPEGRLLISLPVDRPVDDQRRDRFDRLFSGLRADALAALLAPRGLRELRREHSRDALGRDHTTWVTLLFER